MIIETLTLLWGLGAVGGCVAAMADSASNSTTTGTATTQYRTRSGDHYTIRYVGTGSRIRLYALRRPRPRFVGTVAQSHLFPSGEICVAAGQEPRTLERAKAIAVVWMEGYSAYCRTGQFPGGVRRVNV